MSKLEKVVEVEDSQMSAYKVIKGYRFDVISKGQLKKEAFRNNIMEGLNASVDEVADEAIEAIKSGGEVQVAYYNKKIAVMCIFELAEVDGTGKVFRLKSEYKNDGILTSDITEAFERDVNGVLIQKSGSYDQIVFKNTVINKGDYVTKFSYMGIVFGFIIGFSLFGFTMKNIPLGICLGFSFAVCYGLVFAKHEKVNKDGTLEKKDESQISDNDGE